MNIKFRCFVGTNLVDEKLFKDLKSSGCVEVAFGAESASNLLLKNINKKTTVELNTRAVKLAHKIGINIKAFTIIGLPGETEATVEKLRKWLLEVKPDNLDVSLLIPYPGTSIYDNKKDYDIDWSQIDLEKTWYPDLLM